MKPEISICPTCKRKKTRSSEQNRRLHLIFTELAANVKAKDGEYHHQLWWKAMLKDQFLGYDEFKKPDGTTVYSMRSTADLDVAELNEFMARCEDYAAMRGVYLDAMETMA